MRKTLWLVVCLALSVLTANAQNFKNLAGSAEEMDAMRLPSAETLGTRSKSAMLPVKFQNGKWTADIPVETTEDLKISILAPNSKTWQIKAVTDGGEINLRDANLFIEQRDGEVGLDGAKYPAEIFSFEYAKGGTWRIEIDAPKINALSDGETAGFIVISGKSPYRIYTYIDTLETLVGRNIGLRTSVFEMNADSETRIPESLRGNIESATAELRLPNGATQKLNLRDGGNGIFNADFVPRIAGQYTIQITVRGVSPKGEEFIRTSEQIVQVLSENVRFGKSAYSNLIDDTRLEINLPANGLRNGRKVIVYGEVWGKNENGEESAVAWIGGMAIAEGRMRTMIPFTLDGRWLARSNANEGFELRNVRIQDPDYFVTLARADKIALTIPVLPDAAKSGFAEINDEMRMGIRPVKYDTENAVGGKLMLVHGYCSGGNPFPTSQFSSNIVFSDPNKNRTHDQFANLIKNFGAAYPSFGIVAHSQGGAASLHLYTYYWSGLDSATGSRLIQTVGTPYQGTALAGNLAALGSVFGAGCGTNYDLSYNGAASWLAGIPSWARAKVHYSTTSFKDVWYAYDYCNVATDLFLSDPDDGVIERSKGQLSGANNRGHKTGWCHTSGMRDPAQTSDSSRNSDMNANAAR